MSPSSMASVIASAPGIKKVLVAPHERVLWPILILVALFAIWGVWMGRSERRADRARRSEGEPEPFRDGNESSPN